MIEDQPLPSSIDTERALLGALLLDSRLMPQAIEAEIDEDCFHLDTHRRVFRVIGLLYGRNMSFDIITAGNMLDQRKEIDAVGGYSYLASLTEGVPRRPSIAPYVKILKEKSHLRKILKSASRSMTRAFDDSEPAEEVLADLAADVEQIYASAVPRTLEPLFQFAAREYTTPEAFLDRGKIAPGIPYGLEALDSRTGGMHKGELIIIAARPSMGKTALALQIAHKNAVIWNRTVALFSVETSKDALLARVTCQKARVPYIKHLTGYLSQVEKHYISEALAELDERMFLVDDTPGLTVAQLKAKAQRVKQEGGLDLIVIDYVQLMEAPGKFSNRQESVSSISRGLKGVAKALDVPLVALAQLNRENEKRGDKRPLLSDLRESGSIEQDADVVAFIHRPEYYTHDEADAGKAELILAKQRNGPTGSKDAFYAASIMRFFDVDPEKQ